MEAYEHYYRLFKTDYELKKGSLANVLRSLFYIWF